MLSNKEGKTFSNDFNLVDSAYASSRRLNSDYCAPYEKEIIGFKTRIGAVYDVRMEVLSLRKYLFDKVQNICKNENNRIP